MQNCEINAYLETICRIIVSEHQKPSSVDWNSISTDITNKQHAFCSFLWENFLYSHGAKKPHIKTVEEVDYVGLMQRRGRASVGGGNAFSGCYHNAKQQNDASVSAGKPSSQTVIGRLNRLIAQIEDIQGGIDVDIVKRLQSTKEDYNCIYCSQTLIQILCQLESTINFIEKLNKRASYHEDKVSAIMGVSTSSYDDLSESEVEKSKQGKKVKKIKKVIPVSFEEHQLRLIFRNLKRYKYIGQESIEDDFVYYFSGIGKEPTTPIRWCCTELKYLLIFMSEMVPQNKSIPWSRIKNIFSGTYNPDTLKQNWQGQLMSERFNKNHAKIRNEIFQNIA